MSQEVEAFMGRGIEVRVKNNDVNKALRKLKKLMQSEGIFQELRQRESYEKPSLARKRKKAQAKKRWQKKQEELAKLG